MRITCPWSYPGPTLDQQTFTHKEPPRTQTRIGILAVLKGMPASLSNRRNPHKTPSHLSFLEYACPYGVGAERAAGLQE